MQKKGGEEKKRKKKKKKKKKREKKKPHKVTILENPLVGIWLARLVFLNLLASAGWGAFLCVQAGRSPQSHSSPNWTVGTWRTLPERIALGSRLPRPLRPSGSRMPAPEIARRSALPHKTSAVCSTISGGCRGFFRFTVPSLQSAKGRTYTPRSVVLIFWSAPSDCAPLGSPHSPNYSLPKECRLPKSENAAAHLPGSGLRELGWICPVFLQIVPMHDGWR